MRLFKLHWGQKQCKTIWEGGSSYGDNPVLLHLVSSAHRVEEIKKLLIRHWSLLVDQSISTEHFNINAICLQMKMKDDRKINQDTDSSALKNSGKQK